jgi:hypothetical protein
VATLNDVMLSGDVGGAGADPEEAYV